MLGLKLRAEFAGKRLSGTTIDFTNRRGTGALDRSAKEFLDITYPSIDLLKTVESVQPGQARPVVIIGARGQGKSHLMAALSHMLTDPAAGEAWFKEWATTLNNASVANISIRSNMHVIAESLHLQKYKYLWIYCLTTIHRAHMSAGSGKAKAMKKPKCPAMTLYWRCYSNSQQF